MKNSYKTDVITLGVCYYPEHWPDEMMDIDMKRMVDTGIKTIRLAEFAWSLFEPTEGNFTYDYFDKVLDKAASYNLDVIFCTPSATPPAWLTRNYPEVLNASKDGTKYVHGMRRHYNYNSPVYNMFVKRVVTKMAAHYGNHPAIVGWQIDNELNCGMSEFYSQADHKAFRAFVKNKYKTPDNLNACWGNTFWNQTYTSFDEVSLSGPTNEDSTNPHLMLDEKRFFSKSAIDFCNMQVEIIRKYSLGRYITTNSVFPHLDKHELTKTLDFISYDAYPNFAYAMRNKDIDVNGINDRWTSFALCRVRSISDNFVVMEQQSGPGGWTNRLLMPSPKPGQLRLWSYQSLANGADMVSYFRWRTCSYGTEIYWHGIQDYANVPNRRLFEVMKVANEMELLGDLPGSKYEANIALVEDYNNEWDGELDQWYGPFIEKSNSAWYEGLTKRQIPMDVLQMQDSTTIDELSVYKTLVYPHPAILTEKTAQLLAEYAKQGGTVIFGCRTGYKDIFGRCLTIPMPGYAANMTDVNVEDFTFIGNHETAPTVDWNGHIMNAVDFNDVLLPGHFATTLGTFDSNYYEGRPALTVNKVGLGRVYYYGAVFDQSSVAAFIENLDLYVDYGIEAPSQVELAKRGDYIFVLNYSGNTVNIDINKEFYSMLTDEIISDNYKLEGYDVLVLMAR